MCLSMKDYIPTLLPHDPHNRRLCTFNAEDSLPSPSVRTYAPKSCEDVIGRLHVLNAPPATFYAAFATIHARSR